jgi:putative PIN family toxin of toxin-antitoxin system
VAQEATVNVVFDTNVFVSASLGGRMALRALRFAFRRKVSGVTSYECLVKLTRVLRSVVRWDEDKTHHARNLIGARFRVVRATQEMAVCRDPDEKKYLACAVAAQADYLVSMDKDLLDLGEFMGVKIVDLPTFLGVLDREFGLS